MLATQALLLFGGIVGNMLGKIIFGGSVSSALALGLLLQVSTPSSLGPLGILFIFVLIYLTVLGALTFFLFGAGKLIGKVPGQLNMRQNFKTLTLKKSYYYSSVISLVPVLLVAMQSIGRVGFYELILIVLFTIISCVYISKRTT